MFQLAKAGDTTHSDDEHARQSAAPQDADRRSEYERRLTEDLIERQRRLEEVMIRLGVVVVVGLFCCRRRGVVVVAVVVVIGVAAAAAAAADVLA